MMIETKIQGIPCQVLLKYVPPEYGSRDRYTGVKLEPDYPETWEIIKVFDRRGYPASWLEKKITEEDESRILREAFNEEENARLD